MHTKTAQCYVTPSFRVTLNPQLIPEPALLGLFLVCHIQV